MNKSSNPTESAAPGPPGACRAASKAIDNNGTSAAIDAFIDLVARLVAREHLQRCSSENRTDDPRPGDRDARMSPQSAKPAGGFISNTPSPK